LKGGGSGVNGVVVNNCVFTAFPNITLGNTLLFADMTGCVGTLTNCYFGANGKTYKAAGSGALIPATVLMAGNSQEVTASGGTDAGFFSRAS
jgi:hypothetical protein